MKLMLLLILAVPFYWACTSSTHTPIRTNHEPWLERAAVFGPIVKSPPNAAPANEDANQIANPKSTLVPYDFKQIDFRNRSYGRYKFSRARTIDLRLHDGEHEYDFSEGRGWFQLGGESGGVYYADVTSDKNPEAIIVLSHVSCGVSCDGGATLIFIYSVRASKLRRLWRYETGSLAFGCGLRSLRVDNEGVMMELFGRCSVPGNAHAGSGKFNVSGTTLLAFRFNGKRLVRTSTQFISAPERNISNYKPDIRVG